MLRAAYAYCGLPAFVSLSMAGSVSVYLYCLTLRDRFDLNLQFWCDDDEMILGNELPVIALFSKWFRGAV